MQRVRGYLCFIVAVLTFVQPVEAGLFQPDEKLYVPVRPDGTAAELSYGFDPAGQLNLYLDRLADVGDVNPNRKAPNPARADVLARIARRKADPATAKDPAALAALAADLIRTRQADAAVNLLAPHSRIPRPDFRVLVTLAHAHAVRGEWGEAVRAHQSAWIDDDFPAALPGVSPEHRAWLEAVEKRYYRQWLVAHRQEADRRLPPAEEDVFPLFPGVRWVNEAGEYEPGKLAPAERAKLPPDAVAVVQQLLLWDRDDTRLFWLLGELYAAAGRLREAEAIFDQCASEARLYSNRKVLMAHRAAVKRAVAALPPPAAPADVLLTGGSDAPKREETLEDLGISRERMAVVAGLFGVLLVVLVVFQLRALRRRLAGDCGPRG